MTAPKASFQDASDAARSNDVSTPPDVTKTPHSDAMAAPTEPALEPEGLTYAPLIKRATLQDDADSSQDNPQPLRHIESYVGFILDGRYHIESIIAQGGMGVVYLARHRLIDKHVAVKILRPELANNREITARFLTEAQAASAIGSEHIVNVTDYGELPDGATYIVMEYLNGLSLSQRIQRAEPLMPIPVVLDIARQIAEALQRAHDANIVHRDLKPDNILLVTKGKRDDFVKILDFGIAKVQSSQNHTTTAGRIFGTPHYMSPEQGRGNELNHRTDIYSLGVILYEMVCGSVPFDGENPLGILTQHMYVDVKPLSERCPPERVTPALECVVARCLEKDPEGRYASMSELDEDLRRLQELEPPLAVEYFKNAPNPPAYLLPLLRRAAPNTKRSKAWLWPTLALAAVAVLGLWYTNADVALPNVGERAVATPEPTAPPVTETVEVTIVAEPIDAHIFEGEQDLGVNPHTLQILPNQVRVVTVRRPGYRDLTLTIDGNKTRVEAKLRRASAADGARSNETTTALPAPESGVRPPAPDVTTTPGDVSAPQALATALPAASSPPTQASATVETRPTPAAVLQPPDAIDPAWGYAPDPPGPPPSERTPAVASGSAPPPQGAEPAAPVAPPGPPPLTP